MDPPESPQLMQSPSGHIAALTLNSSRPSSPTPQERVIKSAHPRPDDSDQAAADDDTVPHKRQCTNADHVDGGQVIRNKKVPGLSAVKEERGIGEAFVPLTAVKTEPRDVAMADVKDEPGAVTSVAVESREFEQGPRNVIKKEAASTEQSTSAAAHPVKLPTQYVYRSVYATKRDWDRFVPVTTKCDDFHELGPHCALRSSGTEATATICDAQAHVLLKWDKTNCTEFISFSLNLAWSIYFQLKHEFFHFELGHLAKYAEAMEWRDLYALEIPDDDLGEYEFTDRTAINYSNTQQLLLGHLKVRVLRHERVVIPNELRRITMKWCKDRHADFGTYPYSDWRSYIELYAEKHLQAALDPVAMWEEGKSDEEVKKMVEDGLRVHSKPASDYLD